VRKIIILVFVTLAHQEILSIPCSDNFSTRLIPRTVEKSQQQKFCQKMFKENHVGFPCPKTGNLQKESPSKLDAVGTLLYLGRTSDLIATPHHSLEDAKILEMPHRKHPIEQMNWIAVQMRRHFTAVCPAESAMNRLALRPAYDAPLRIQESHFQLVLAFTLRVDRSNDILRAAHGTNGFDFHLHSLFLAGNHGTLLQLLYPIHWYIFYFLSSTALLAAEKISASINFFYVLAKDPCIFQCWVRNMIPIVFDFSILIYFPGFHGSHFLGAR